MPQNSVRRIVQTSDGYLWLTTLDGLVRFDGVRFTVFNKSNSKNLPGNRFVDLFAEADDTLWISMEEEGLVRYRDGKFSTFTTADGLSSNIVGQVLLKSDGNLYVPTVNGLARFDGTGFTGVSTRKELAQSRSLSAASGSFWEINKDSLSVLKNGQKSVFDLPAALKNEFSPDHDFNYWVRLFEDRQGILWISTKRSNESRFSSNKLFKFADGKFAEIVAEGVPRSLISDIAEDRSGTLWFGTVLDGACRLEQNKFNCFNSENKLTTNSTRTIFTDREGTLWLTSEDKGIYRVGEQIIVSLSTKEGLAEKNAYVVFEDRSGAIWIGALGALTKYKDGRITNYRRQNGLIYTDIQSLFEDANGRLWIGNFNGIQYFENGKFYDFMKNLPPRLKGLSVFAIHEDRQRILWFASSFGLIKYDGKSFEVFTKENGLPGNNVKTMVENEDGSMWIGTYDGIALMKDEKFTAFTETDGLAGNHVRSLYKDETGTLWIGTYESGLSRFKDGKFTNYTTENGLASNGVFQILEDSVRNFWISSNQGIYRVSRAQLNEFADGKISSVTSTLFGKSDGMLSTEANGGGQPAGIKASDGRLWFPTQDGAAIIKPEAVMLNALPPPVVIESARIDNQKIDRLEKKIEINPGQENLEIDYTGLSFIKPEQVRFRYKLEGLEENWTEAGNRRTAFYPHLAPGEYVFQVIAANSDNVWNEQGARIKIIVKPPFYRRWWFIALAVLLAAGMVFAMYRRQISKLEKDRAAQQAFSRQLLASQEHERKRIAAELHDSLGQRLVVIKNLALMLLHLNKGQKLDVERIEGISAEASQALGEVQEISYNLRPYQLDRIGLTKAVEAIIGSAKTASTIEISAEIDDIDDYFPRDAEINFYRIVQECVGNLVKHSEATEAFVKIELSGENLTLEISDNGKGFAPNNIESKKGGFGLIGLVERAELFGGNIEIKSAPNQGTTIKIRLNSRNFLRD